MATVTVVRGEKPSADYAMAMALERGHIPLPRRMKTKKSEAMHLLADIEVEGPTVAPGKDAQYTAKLCSQEKTRCQAFTQTYSKAVPTEELLTFIAGQTKDGPVLELFAETGVWAFLLNAIYEIQVIPTDEKPSTIMQYGRVELMKPLDAIDAFSDCKTLLMSWPPSNTEEDHDAVVRFRGDKIIFMGVPGKCGSPKLQALLSQNYVIIESVPMRPWYWNSGEELQLLRKK